MNDINKILGLEKELKHINISEKQLFTVPVYLTHVSEWKTKKSRILSLIPFEKEKKYKNDPLITYTDYFGGGQKKEKYKDEFISMINPYVLEFSKNSPYKFEGIKALWAQKYCGSDFHCPHDHGPIGYSCVFYANYDHTKHSGTHFLPPFINASGHKPLNEIKVKEGDLLIFPSNLTHMSIPHKSNSERVIISFNLT